jgi:hypothetical protein
MTLPVRIHYFSDFSLGDGVVKTKRGASALCNPEGTFANGFYTH